MELVHEHWLGVPQSPDLERHLRGHRQEHGGEEPVPADGPGDGICVILSGCAKFDPLLTGVKCAWKLRRELEL